MGRSLANFVNTKSPILLYELLLVQDRRSGASNILFLSARSPILSYNYRLNNMCSLEWCTFFIWTRLYNLSHTVKLVFDSECLTSESR